MAKKTPVKKAIKKKPERTNAQQSRYLLDRISRCYYPRAPKVREPREVVAARRVLEKHRAQQQAKDNRASAAWSRRVKAAKDAVLFKTPQEALRAVEALEGACNGGD